MAIKTTTVGEGSTAGALEPVSTQVAGGRDSEARMSFFDHLDELRKRLVKISIVLFVFAGISFSFADRILELIKAPLPDNVSLYFASPMAGFMAKVKIAFIAGAVLAMPWIIYQVMAFLSPALTKKEKRVIYPILAAGAVLAAGGIVAGYLYIFPLGIKWLIAQGASIDLSPILMIDQYVSFSMFFLLGMGVAAETPMILLAAIKFGIVTPETLKKNWRVVYIVILIAASVITPDWSPVTMVAVALPMAILYHVTLLFSRWVRPREGRA